MVGEAEWSAEGAGGPGQEEDSLGTRTLIFFFFLMSATAMRPRGGGRPEHRAGYAQSSGRVHHPLCGLGTVGQGREAAGEQQVDAAQPGASVRTTAL